MPVSLKTTLKPSLLTTIRIDDLTITESVFLRWRGSGNRFGTIHGKLVWEFTFLARPEQMPLISCDFNLNDSLGISTSRIAVFHRFRQYLIQTINNADNFCSKIADLICNQMGIECKKD